MFKTKIRLPRIRFPSSLFLHLRRDRELVFSKEKGRRRIANLSGRRARGRKSG
jgi:hypothetical protein